MSPPLNVVVIAVDALRADHLGCYGYERATSPNIDRLAEQGVLSERFYCSAIPTHPSFTTLYAGQHAVTHGVVSHGGDAKLAPETPTFPQVFLKSGYTTCAIDNLMRERLWFGRGYEYYIDSSLRRVLNLGVTCEELNHRGLPWLRSHASEPFLFFVHYWDPHAPYTPPEKYRGLFYEGDPCDPSNRSLEPFWAHPFGAMARDSWLRSPAGLITDADYVAALYDQEIRHVDDGIGALLETIDDLGLADRTLVILLGDHGESMTEHGIFFEHHGLYDATLHIPLIVRCPGRTPQSVRVPQMLQTHRLAPTILEAAGLPVPPTMHGQSFWPLLSGQTQEGGQEAAVSLECTLQAKWSLRTVDYKFILSREPDFYGNPMRELYDLENDPLELRNIAEERSQLAAEMEDRLEAWIAEELKRAGRRQDPLIEQGISLRAVLEVG